MGIYIIFNILPAWVRLVVGIFPGLESLFSGVWYDHTDPEIDDILPRH